MKYTDLPVVTSFLPKAVKKIEPRRRVSENMEFSQTPLVVRVREGLPFAEFKALQQLLELPEEELGRLLGMSPATLGRRKKRPQLTMAESERIVRFARLYGLAFEVFENQEAARSWLKTANRGTAGEAPLGYADTEFGAREVENLLGRIDHGVF